MNILHVIPGLTAERGGTTAVVQALAKHQAAAGHAVTVLTTDQGQRHGEHASEPPPAVRVERVAVKGPDRIAYAPAFADTVRAHLRQSAVVHVHSIFTYPVHAALREAAALGVPAVLAPHGQLHPYSLSRSRWKKRLYLALWGRMVRRACRAWHYTSEPEADASWPHDASPRFVLPNGVEMQDFSLDRGAARSVVERAFPELHERPYVLFLGRLHTKKRLDLLLDAFLAAAPPACRLVVAGPDEERLWEPLARRYLSDGGAAKRVLSVGHVAGELKTALLTAAELFALPSEHENFGIAALESLAAGVPVLLSPHVDLAPAAAAAGFGAVAPLDAGAWKERLAALLGDSPLPAGDAARRWVRANYSWDVLAARLVERYEALRG
jgi:glycosyltransferase involved in cell wall biosynthesis